VKAAVRRCERGWRRIRQGFGVLDRQNDFHSASPGAQFKAHLIVPSALTSGQRIS
jgi:hypothetical protein